MASSYGEEIVAEPRSSFDPGSSMSGSASRLRARNPWSSGGAAPAPGELPEYVSSERSSDVNPKRMKRESWSLPFDLWGVGSIVLTVVIAFAVMKLVVPSGVKPRIWTAQDLARYDGSNSKLPLLLSILGSVFDVSEGKRHYGPGGGYHHFVGRDASRAYFSGNFSGDGLTDSLEGLTALQVKQINDWKVKLTAKYVSVGPLVGRFYDEKGKPTLEMARVRQQLALAQEIFLQQEADQERFPSCNSQWSEELGAQMWCNVGHPRIMDKISKGELKGSTGFRCACVEEEFLSQDGLRLYEGCEPTAKRCQSAPPRLPKAEVA